MSKSIPRTEDGRWRWRTRVLRGREGAGLGAAQCAHPQQQQPPLEPRACDSWHSRGVRLLSPPCSQVPQKHLCFEAASPSRGLCARSSGETWFSVPHEPDCPLWRQVTWTSGVFVPTWSTCSPIHPVPRAFTWQPDFPWGEHDGHSCAGTFCWTSRGNTSPFPADACAGLSVASWVTLGKSFMARGLAFSSIK